MTGEWRCLDCPERGEGAPADVDRAARRHTEKPPKHATVTMLRPSKENR